jgi:hypothetical protein
LNPNNLEVPDKKSGIFFQKKFAVVNSPIIFAIPNNNTMSKTFRIHVAQHDGLSESVQYSSKANAGLRFDQLATTHGIEYAQHGLCSVFIGASESFSATNSTHSITIEPYEAKN